MNGFIYYGTEALGTAGAMAVGILMVSTAMRMWFTRKLPKQ